MEKYQAIFCGESEIKTLCLTDDIWEAKEAVFKELTRIRNHPAYGDDDYMWLQIRVHSWWNRILNTGKFAIIYWSEIDQKFTDE